MSYSDTRLTALLASVLNELGAEGSASTMSASELLARIHNAVSEGPDLSNLTSSVSDILAGIHNAVSDGPDVSPLTLTPTEMLAGIRNALSGVAPITPLTVSAPALWHSAFALVGAFTPQGGGSGPPSWVPQAPSGDYALVYSDFAHDRHWVGNSAGVGAQATLLDVWGENLDFGPFFPGQIGGGLGLWGTNAQGTNSAVMLEAVAAPLVAGFTHVMTLYADPAGVSTESTSLVAFADLPAENQYYEQDTRLYSTASPTSFISSDLANVHIVNQQDGGGVKKTAATFLFTTQTISYMGGAILSCIGSAPLPDSYLAISNNNTDTSSPFAYIQSVAFFRPQPDAALPTLSTP